jgi:hypothetical protein
LDGFDHFTDFAGGPGCAFGQCPDFISYDSKSTSLLTGAAQWLHSGKQIGLVGIFNRADNLAYLVERLPILLRWPRSDPI